MRENGARVLVAALMTGAIAFALAMPAVFGTSAQDAVRSLTSPPSSLQRSVHVVASALPHPLRAGRLEPTHSIARAVPGSTVSTFGRHPDSTGASVPKAASRPAPRPIPQPAPAGETRVLAGATPAVPVVQPAAASEAKSGHGKGKGKGRNKSKERGKPTASVSQPVPATPPAPAAASPGSGGEKDHGKDKGGKAKGHDK
jgi:hypothetical protein